jgi:ATP-dependent exoDNAse (exonuclease V) beta subunit
MAVLAATHVPLKALAKTMRNRGIPYALSTAVNIFEQPELIGLWYLLKWLCWQADEGAVGHVIMGPFVGWTADQYRRLLEASREGLITVEEALRVDDSEAARQLVERLDEWRDWAQELSVSQLAFRLVFETGMADRWRQQAATSARMIRVFEDLQRLLEQMQDFETVAINTTLDEYSRTFPKPPTLEVSEPLGEEEGVQLLTVHASKGLEFETVYLIGCSQRNWSGGRTLGRIVPEALRSNKPLSGEHEYRRLMYVAATRARQSLGVSAPTQTMQGARQIVTPFVAELFGPEAAAAEPSGGATDRLEKALCILQRFYPMHQAFDRQTMPFEDNDGWLELSVTQLGAYEYCPFEFYMQSVLQIKQPLGPQLAFGSVLHRVFERYYKARLAGQNQTLAELTAMLDELWSDRGYEHQQLADRDRRLAHDTLAAFVKRESELKRTVVGSEVPIKLDLPEAKLRLRGKIDALFETSDGVELRDFKTGRTKTDPEKLAKEAKDNFQLRTYALAYELLRGKAPAQVVLDYVVTGAEGAASLSATILRNHRAKLETLATSIRNREFAPNPSPMHACAAIRYYGTGEADELLEAAMTAQGEA